MTGAFDNWSKSEQLEKVGDVFEKTVTLSDVSQKIFYKVRGTTTSMTHSTHLPPSPLLIELHEAQDKPFGPFLRKVCAKSGNCCSLQDAVAFCGGNMARTRLGAKPQPMGDLISLVAH